MASLSKTTDALDILERGLIRGRARWVADLSEFFRDFRVRDSVFSLYARGGTRNRGFMISKFFAWSVLPNYNVALFCLCSDSNKGNISPERLKRTIEDVLHHIRQRDLKWAWLIILMNSSLPAWAVSQVSKYERTEIGIALASTSTGQVIVSHNQIGKSIQGRLGLMKLVGKIANDNSN